MTTPLNNIVHNVKHLDPKYNFQYTFRALFPSIIRDNFFPEDKSVVLHSKAFNAASIFRNFMADFGISGAIIIIFFLQAITLRFYFSAKSGLLGSMIAYSALFYAVATSIFVDNFFTLITIFQVFLGIIINQYIYLSIHS